MSLMMEGKTIVVAGVGTGLGSQVGRIGLREGARVVLAARSADTLDAIARELDPSGERVLTVPTDITDEAQCQRLADAAVARFGGIDAICQVAAHDRFFGGLGQVTREEWMAAFELGVVGSAQFTKACVPSMKARGGGSVVFIGSHAAFIPLVPQIAYGAAKGALTSASYFMAQELAADNIRVNTVVATYMMGPALEGYIRERAEARGVSEAEVEGELSGTMPLGRIPTDAEVAESVIFFASERASTITGQQLLVNSGLVMH
jgi:NAD(P)-dependent dehydrogenase (short-subunit alcohol dehydrogenase family)